MDEQAIETSEFNVGDHVASTVRQEYLGTIKSIRATYEYTITTPDRGDVVYSEPFLEAAAYPREESDNGHSKRSMDTISQANKPCECQGDA